MEVYRAFKRDIVILSIVYIILFLITAWNSGRFSRDSTDGFYRSGMALRIDAMTGCNYLESVKGFLIPRLNSQGEHICNK